MATSLFIGMEERDSARRRRQHEYRQDLELQMRERTAAKQRERLQDMSVDASGWLDPEKRPERLKPLGGMHWTEQRGRRNERVRPYHTLFTYGSTPAAAGVLPGGPVDQAYSYMGAQDIGYGRGGGGGGSIVQPVTLPYSDNRPIIIQGGGRDPGYSTARTVVEYRDDGAARELRQMLGLMQTEKDRMRRENDDFQRRMLRDLEDEKRKLHEQEEDARRRMERIRRETEENRRQAERQRLEAERLRREAATRPKSAEPASVNTRLYKDMDEHRRRMMEERQRIEDLLRRPSKPISKDVWDIRVLKKPRFHLSLPVTPSTDDRANRENVLDFNDLKQRDFGNRDEFRQIYPDVPYTNRRLEEQQEALLQHQARLPSRGFNTDRPTWERRVLEIEPRRAVSRPGWLDRTPTPFEHVQKEWDKKYGGSTTKSEKSPKKREKLNLRSHRPYSTETLSDDTWLRPSETDLV